MTKKTQKLRKVLTLAACAVLLVSVTIVGTVAYLTSTTDPVTNTFTVGNVVITLDEAPVDADGKEIDGDRVTQNSYELLPGHEYDKDPTIHVDANSESCWLFVKVENQIADIEDAITIANQMKANGWNQVDGETDVYWHDVAEANEDVVVFENFKIKGDVINSVLDNYAGKTIKVTAYAVQEDGFKTADEAWDAAPASWN